MSDVVRDDEIRMLRKSRHCLRWGGVAKPSDFRHPWRKVTAQNGWKLGGVWVVAVSPPYLFQIFATGWL